MKSNKLLKFFIGGMITSFLFVLAFTFTSVFAAEGETASEEQGAIQTAIEWLKTWSIDDLKGWIIGVFSFLGINTTIILTLAIALIRGKITKINDSKFYKELEAKLNAEHQKKMEDFIKSVDDKLSENQQLLIDQMNKLDEKKKAEAQANIEVLKTQLEDIKIDVEK